MEEVLHLFITNRCRHDCKLCCNKFYDIEKIPVVTVELLKSVDTVCLTGGEPFCINSDILRKFIRNIRRQYKNINNLYIYSSGEELGNCYQDYFSEVSMGLINGINIAPKDIDDWLGFRSIIDGYILLNQNMSNRLYVFKEQKVVFDAFNFNLGNLNIKVIDRQWDKIFNTPDNEHFARLPILM